MPGELAIRPAQLTAEQIELVKRTVAVGASDDELALFLYTAQRSGLDPLTKQVYCIKRGGKMSIQTGIDGYRAIAERSGTLAGIDDVVYDALSGATRPMKATVTVWRIVAGQRVSFTSSARWEEYVQCDYGGNPQGLWKKMPFLMLGKCAEALALRKAFPHDLSGLYTHEEMMQADGAQPAAAPVEPTPVQVAEPSRPLTPEGEKAAAVGTATPELLAQKQRVIAAAARLGIVYEAPGILFRNRVENLVQMKLEDANLEGVADRLEVLVSEQEARNTPPPADQQ